MAAFIPSRTDPEVNSRAFAKVRQDKERESRAGHDGTWVAHPDLVPLATEVFDEVLGDRPDQIDRLRPDIEPKLRLCSTSRFPGARSPEPASGSTSTSASATWPRGWPATVPPASTT